MSTLKCGEREYEVTPEDELWLLRAVAKEGRPHDWVAQTLVNCFSFLHARKPKSWPTLTKLIRAYAQPVNPKWFPEGSLFKLWRARDPEKYPVSVARARRDVHSTKTKFPEHVRSAVEKALTEGPVDIPANATDYAAPWIDATRKGMKPLTDAKRGVNRFWVRRGASGWEGYSVVPESPAPSPSSCCC